MTFVREFRQLSPSGARIFLSSGHFFTAPLCLRCARALGGMGRRARWRKKFESWSRASSHTHTKHHFFFFVCVMRLFRVFMTVICNFYSAGRHLWSDMFPSFSPRKKLIHTMGTRVLRVTLSYLIIFQWMYNMLLLFLRLIIDWTSIF